MTAALLFLLAALQVLDWVTTRRVLDQGGRELNPVMRWLFALACERVIGWLFLNLTGEREHCCGSIEWDEE